LGSWQVREAAHWYFLVAICQVLIDSFGSISSLRDRQKSPKSGRTPQQQLRGLSQQNRSKLLIMAVSCAAHDVNPYQIKMNGRS